MKSRFFVIDADRSAASWSTADYPHADAAEKFPEHSVGELAKNSNLSEAMRRKILWNNPARLYGIRETPSKL